MRLLILTCALSAIAGCIPNTGRPLPDLGRPSSDDVGPVGDVDAAGEPTIDLAPWLDVSVGGDHVCGIAAEGRLYCWGANRFADGSTGKLGAGFDGDVTRRPMAVDVEDELRFRDVEASRYHTCALTTEGELFCWGSSLDGEVAPGAQGVVRKPARIAEELEPFADVAVGMTHTCVLQAAAVTCWGRDINGEVGEPVVEELAHHPEVMGAQFVVAGAVNTCTLDAQADLDLHCWGDNTLGILTENDCAAPCSSPVAPRFEFPPLTHISMSASHVCAVADSGEVYCWGNADLLAEFDADDTYKLGFVGPQDRETPRAVTPLRGGDFVSVSAGWDHSCAVTEEGVLYCWGFNAHGEIGVRVGTSPRGLAPNAVSTEGHEWKVVSAGNQVTCAIDTDSELFCWGRNDVGQLGDGGSESTDHIQRVLGSR